MINQQRPINVIPNYACQACPLRGASPYQPVWGTGPAKPLLMLVGDGPNEVDARAGRFFHLETPAGQLVQTLLAQANVSPDQVYVTGATRCYRGQRLVTTADIKACHTHLAQEIQAIQPRLVVLMGNRALKSIVGHEGIAKERSKLITIAGQRYLTTFSPDAALREQTPEYQRLIVQDLQHAVKLSQADNVDSTAGLNLHLATTNEHLTQLEHELKALTDDTLVFFDFETNGLRTPFQTTLPPALIPAHSATRLTNTDSVLASNARKPIISGMAVCWAFDQAYFIPVDHLNPEANPAFRRQATALVRWFLASNLPKGGQNVKFDALWAWGYFGLPPKRICVDTMLLSHLLDPTRGIHALEKLAMQVGLAGYTDELTQWFTQQKIAAADQDWSTAPLALVARKSMIDVISCYRFDQLKHPLLVKRGQEQLYYQHVVPGIQPYLTMERIGMLTDQVYLTQLVQRYQARCAKALQQLHAAAAQGFKLLPIEFNFDSPAQVGKVIEEWFADIIQQLTIVTASKHPTKTEFREFIKDRLTQTANGKLSTSKENIAALAAVNGLDPCRKSFVMALLQYKGDKKRLTTNIQGLSEHICPDGRVRSTYLLHGTETSRRASVNPNRQNDPKNTEIKRIYVAAPNCVFIINDYSNLEVRVAASLSRDQGLIKAFQDGRDIHSYVTSLTYGIAYEKLINVLNNADAYPKDYAKYFKLRFNCKGAMWTVLFGGGPQKVADQTNLSLTVATALIDKILNEFSGLKHMFDRLEEFALIHGYAKTMFGRWRLLPGIHSTNKRIQSLAIRQGLNTPIQGSAADVTLTAARRLNTLLRPLAANLVQEVHDSLVIETHLACLHTVMVESRRVMEAIQLPTGAAVPLTIDQVVGCHLGSRLKVDKTVLTLAATNPQQLYEQLQAELNHDPAYYEEA